MEVADPDGIDAESAADGIAGPRPEDSGARDEQDPAASPPAQEHEQGDVEYAYQERQYVRRAESHFPPRRG